MVYNLEFFFTKTMGLKVKFGKKTFTNNGVEGFKKKILIFLSLRLQKCIMVIFFRIFFWVYGYPGH
jgi:hypothetical protein